MTSPNIHNMTYIITGTQVALQSITDFASDAVQEYPSFIKRDDYAY